jgi:hypothetical protein
MNSLVSFLQIIQAEIISNENKVNHKTLNLSFESQNQIEIQHISFWDSNITLNSFNFCGCISFFNCIVSINNSHFINSNEDHNASILVDEKTLMILTNSVIQSNDQIGLMIQNQSVGVLTNCTIENSLCVIIIDSECKVNLKNCKMQNFHDVKNSNCIQIINSQVQIYECFFFQPKLSAIYLNQQSNLHLSTSIFSHIGQCFSMVGRQSKIHVQNCITENTFIHFPLFAFNDSKGEFSNCTFSKIP